MLFEKIQVALNIITYEKYFQQKIERRFRSRSPLFELPLYSLVNSLVTKICLCYFIFFVNNIAYKGVP